MDMTIAEYIKKVRKDRGLTQLQFCEEIGIKRHNLAKYETGVTTPPGDILIKIQKFAGDFDKCAA